MEKKVVKLESVKLDVLAAEGTEELLFKPLKDTGYVEYVGFMTLKETDVFVFDVVAKTDNAVVGGIRASSVGIDSVNAGFHLLNRSWAMHTTTYETYTTLQDYH